MLFITAFLSYHFFSIGAWASVWHWASMPGGGGRGPDAIDAHTLHERPTAGRAEGATKHSWCPSIMTLPTYISQNGSLWRVVFVERDKVMSLHQPLPKVVSLSGGEVFEWRGLYWGRPVYLLGFLKGTWQCCLHNNLSRQGWKQTKCVSFSLSYYPQHFDMAG